jgi:hypothetical protein
MVQNNPVLDWNHHAAALPFTINRIGSDRDPLQVRHPGVCASARLLFATDEQIYADGIDLTERRRDAQFSKQLLTSQTQVVTLHSSTTACAVLPTVSNASRYIHTLLLRSCKLLAKGLAENREISYGIATRKGIPVPICSNLSADVLPGEVMMVQNPR